MSSSISKKTCQSIGIDLGTTHSVVSYKDTIIENAEGRRLTESCVYFSPAGKEVLIGRYAYLNLGKHPEHTINNVKRLIGRDTDNNEVISQDNTFFGYRVVSVDNMKAIAIPNNTEGKYRVYMPEQISSLILQKLLKDTEQRLGKKITCAVVTIPAYFNNQQRERTRIACEQAKIPLIRLLNEPTAAVLAYGLNKKLQQSDDSTILVYDIGGSTTDVSLIQMDELGMFQVLATSGDVQLGGREFDQALARYIINHHKLLKLSDRARQNLLLACERAKCDLSNKLETTLCCESLDIQIKLTRAKFEDICSSVFQWCENPIDELLDSESVNMQKIREIILVGGTSRIPKIKKLLQNKIPNASINCSMNPDEVVAQGAGIYAEHLMNMKHNFKDDRETGKEEEVDGINNGDFMELPDDDDILDVGIQNMCLIDVCPMTIGIESDVGMMVPIIPRHTVIPCEKTQVFTTEEDSQEFVTIKVFEGERQLSRFCHKVAEFRLTDIQKAPRGIPRIEVTYALDSSGVLTVTAVDKTTGVTKNITVNEKQLTEHRVGQLGKDGNERNERNERKHKISAKQAKINDVLLIDAISATNNLNKRIYDIREFAIHMADYTKSKELMTKIKDANKYLTTAKVHINKNEDDMDFDIIKQIAFQAELKSNELINFTEKLLEESGALRDKKEKEHETEKET